MSKRRALILFFRLMEPRCLQFLGATGILVLETVLAIGAALLIRPLFDHALLQGRVRSAALILISQGALYAAGAGLGLRRLSAYANIGAKAAEQLAAALYEALGRQGLKFFSSMKLSEIHQRVYADTQALEGALSQLLGVSLVSCFKIIAVFTLMIWWNHRLALASVLALAALALLARHCGEKSQRILEAQLGCGAALSHHLFQSLSLPGYLLSTTFAVHGANQKRFENLYSRLKSAALERQSCVHFYSQAMSLVTHLLGLAIFFAGAFFIAQHSMTVGALMSYAALSGYLTGPAIQVANASVLFRESFLRWQRIWELIERPSEIPERAAALRALRARGFIEFKEMGFHYEPHVPLFNGLTFSFEPGSITAVTGRSGCGKTTLSYLVMRLLDPLSGAIELDGWDLRDWELGRLRRQFSYLAQEPFIFNGTIRENLTLGRNLDSQEIEEACRLCGFEERWRGSCEGLETQLGEGGAGLSGGEKQRLALARALLKQAPIYIFDEPTAFLDPKTAECLNEVFDILKRRQATVLLITHNFSLAAQADAHLDLSPVMVPS